MTEQPRNGDEQPEDLTAAPADGSTPEVPVPDVPQPAEPDVPSTPEPAVPVVPGTPTPEVPVPNVPTPAVPTDPDGPVLPEAPKPTETTAGSGGATEELGETTAAGHATEESHETAAESGGVTEQAPATPRPTPRAGPTPAAAAPAPAAAAAPEPSDPSQWGRVDDDGTVWVRTADGERSVGSYPGAEPPEALAYFGRKFDELAGQVSLLEQRVVAGGVSLQDAQTSIEHLREAVTDANAVGDLAGLLARLDELTKGVAARKARRETERAKMRERAAQTKDRIATEAESLAESTDWKRTGDRLRELLDEWKAAPRLDRKTDDALWKRFSHARTAFDKRRRAHFAELDEQRGEAAVRKEKLVKEAEALASSKEWGETAKRFRELMAQWKAAGRARRDVEDQLWQRFRAAQDTFFSARNEVFAARDADLAVNLEKKRALLVEAEALLPVTDPRSARSALRSIHDRWEAAGHVPRGDRDAVEGRLRKVDEAVRAAEEAAWARSNPEARARAEATVTQLRSSIAALEAEAASARSAGNEKKAAEAEAAAATRATWLAEAEKTLAEFS